MSKLFIGCPAYIFDDEQLLKVWSKGFLKGFGQREKHTQGSKTYTPKEYVSLLRVCRGKKLGYIKAEKRGIRIRSLAGIVDTQ